MRIKRIWTLYAHCQPHHNFLVRYYTVDFTTARTLQYPPQGIPLATFASPDQTKYKTLLLSSCSKGDTAAWASVKPNKES